MKPYWTKDFQEILTKCERRIKEILNCDGRIFFLTCAGTGALDAVVSNFIREKTIVINSGLYGKTWLDICKFYEIEAINYHIGGGKNIDFADLEKTIEKEKPKFLLTQHVETSTGQKHDIEKIGEICRKHNVRLFVDAISSFMGEEYDAEKFGADVTIINPKKGLGLQQGISIVALSRRMTEAKSRSFYFDFRRYGGPFKIPYTPNTDLIEEMCELLEVDVEAQIEKTKKLAEHFRGLIKDLKLKIIAENPANSYTVLNTWYDANVLFKKICTKKIYFSPYNRWTIIVPHIKTSFGGPRWEPDNIKLWQELKTWIS